MKNRSELRDIVIKVLYQINLLEEAKLDYNIEELIKVFNAAKEKDGPVVVHVVTKKGKGYRYAEQEPNKYHGVSKFDIKEGIKSSGVKSISAAVGEKLIDMANNDDRIVAITAAMPSGTGLNLFANKYPNRYFDPQS